MRSVTSMICQHPGDYGELIDSLDVMNCLRLIDRRWNEVFRTKLSLDYRTWSKELVGVRNKAAHIGGQDFSKSYAERALDTMALLCEAFDADGVEEIRALYRKLRYGSEEGSVAAATVCCSYTDQDVQSQGERWCHDALPSGSIFQAGVTLCSPILMLRKGVTVPLSLQRIWHRFPVARELLNIETPVEFFARTYVTEGMAGLLVESLQRISGQGGEPGLSSLKLHSAAAKPTVCWRSITWCAEEFELTIFPA